jgi:hypothetical protein
MHREDEQSKLDLISAKLSADQQFAKKFFNDFEFAKDEFVQVGLQISYPIFHELVASYKGHIKLEAESNTNKKSPREYSIYTKLSIISGLTAAIITSLYIYWNLSKSSV